MLDKSQLSRKISSTLNPQEVAKFDSLAEQWWDPIGKYGQAIAFNHARLAYFTTKIAGHFEIDLRFTPEPNANLWQLYDLGTPLEGLSVLDVGCGGGLVSEPLARLGARVTGIDASAMSIQVAMRHATNTGATVDYQHVLAEEIVASGQQFDVVINAEVVEHVDDQAALIAQCAQLVKPGGMLILATLNRTFTAYVLAIVGAEYVMRYLPVGTHSWRKFVKPSELVTWTQAANCHLIDETGMKFNIFNKQWRYTDNMEINYVQCFTKE
ncbi:MAG: bifunctional 2-polyprenyl-6-hydroxyphenol methylase/3-demethylubiquinol 3-O-methyltransferase UbiG [Glaciecola sp.]|nr:bifunctional 2-polyprenyl-6-hydroxyphenol methylase/3-demethylubiquinol 3-O-methyltransferase UbiG [Glaciecola sp.]MDG1816587.1 bifunctional 2-polyprenyl-6-hydroxyphenol methylase/3-demethylubiquinol 3-O-methyltransferase UbiG [Glaciecola sp.]MDG2098853.1 bifunctional 2-polyprenyl-6-hydroxyphenol methylase/3-demethylubiquinol 3-O-methyltransferase UbiG [Glaciecola sp.]